MTSHMCKKINLYVSCKCKFSWKNDMKCLFAISNGSLNRSLHTHVITFLDYDFIFKEYSRILWTNQYEQWTQKNLNSSFTTNQSEILLFEKLSKSKPITIITLFQTMLYPIKFTRVWSSSVRFACHMTSLVSSRSP